MARRCALGVAEMERRAPVWAALSSLFLDTPLVAGDVDRIARAIIAAGYDAHEATDILEHEVAPVFFTNLLGPAGEWTPWPDAFVRERVAAFRASNPFARWLGRRAAGPAHALYAQDWAAIVDRMNQPATEG